MSKRQEGGTKEKENSENTKAARPMQGTSGPRPVTADSIDILENLSDKELINEICFLRATVAPEI